MPDFVAFSQVVAHGRATAPHAGEVRMPLSED